MTLEAKANNIRMAFDFRDSSWKTVEFLQGKKDKIKIYTTAEDVTDIYFAKYVNGEVKHYLIRRMKKNGL